jgi:ABC-type Fe3+/spermidine/putrescine transport system ATPase subunit
VTALYSDQAFDVELRAVTKRFGSLTAVNAVTLKVHKGEFLSLLGPSGCGKTTSLRLIAGFERPDEGEILIGGRDAADAGAQEVRRHHGDHPARGIGDLGG